jgi:hypothetical protein
LNGALQYPKMRLDNFIKVCAAKLEVYGPKTCF